MSSHGFTSAFAADLEAYLAFKASMGFYRTSRIWYLRRFDAYCREHNHTVFDRDTVEEWVSVQLQQSGRYRSWMSYIRDFGRWLSMHGATDAYVLSEWWKAPILAPHPYLLAAREIELFFSAAAQLQVQSPWRWQAVAFFTLMHSCGLRTGETRALQPGQVDLDGGHIDIVWSKGHRSRRLPLTDQVIEILTACDRTSRTHFASRHTFFVSATGNQVTAATVGKMFGRIWDQAALPRPVAGQQPRPYDFRHHFAYANIHRWTGDSACRVAGEPRRGRCRSRGPHGRLPRKNHCDRVGAGAAQPQSALRGAEVGVPMKSAGTAARGPCVPTLSGAWRRSTRSGWQE